MDANSDRLTDGSTDKNADSPIKGISDGLLNISMDRISKC